MVKWAFSYVGGKYGQPTLVGGRLFLTSTGGAVYSLDPKTGCMFWRFARSAPSRTTVSVGPAPNVVPSGYAAYFGDLSANVYAVDAASGALLWKTRVDPHPRAVLTGSPTLFKIAFMCRSRPGKRVWLRLLSIPAAHSEVAS